ncbi:MAG: zinc ribbon domain-containing protein [Oscillospiraceae bacterium]|nr:zinc ribbon domain-containing protein [Oscillospiraceae bacterium]
MYCFKCGSYIEADSKFCSSCGVSQLPPASGPEVNRSNAEINQSGTEVNPPGAGIIQSGAEITQPGTVINPPQTELAQSVKSKKWITITVISAASAAVLLMAGLAAYFMFFRDVSHVLLIGRAFNKLSSEMEERIDNTPFKALVMLPDILEDGTVTANIDYSFSYLDDFIGFGMGADIVLSSNTKTREFALSAAIKDSGESTEADIYMNKERLALRVGILGDNFYGITYDTFRDDIEKFGRLIGLDSETMDELSDIVDLLSTILSYEEEDSSLLEIEKEYIETALNFARSIKTKSTRTSIESAGEQVRCTAIEMIITKEGLITLFTDLLDILENNEDFQAEIDLFDMPFLYDLFGEIPGANRYNTDMLKAFIKDIEENYFGDITTTFYIGRDDRLLRLNININAEIYGDYGDLNITFNFGNSIYDDWTMSINFSDEKTEDNKTEDNETEKTYDNIMKIIWSYAEISGTYTNSMTISIHDESETITFTSAWEQESGNFILSYTDDLDTDMITGLFKPDEKNFKLEVHNTLSDVPGGKFSISISAETGSQIREITFVNIDKWGDELLSIIIRLLLGGIFG